MRRVAMLIAFVALVPFADAGAASPAARERTEAGPGVHDEREAARLLEQAVRCQEMGLAKTLRSAEILFRKIIRRYPGTPQAAEAERRLEHLGRSGNPDERKGPGSAPIPEVDLWRLPHWSVPGESVQNAPGDIRDIFLVRRILSQC